MFSTVKVLSIWTDSPIGKWFKPPDQTALLREQSDQGYTVCHSACDLLDTYLINFRII